MRCSGGLGSSCERFFGRGRRAPPHLYGHLGLAPDVKAIPPSVLCVAIASAAIYALSACGTASAPLPTGLRDGILQTLVTSGDAYRNYQVVWTVTSIGDLQAAAPVAAGDLLSGTTYFKSVYVAEIRGSFFNSLCVPGHGSTCRGAYLLVALPIASGPGGYAEASDVTARATPVGSLGSVRYSTLEGLAREGRGRVPDVVGLGVDQATSILRRAGFSVSEVVGGVALVPATVTRQVPAPGSTARHGQVVGLVVAGP